MSSPKTLEVTSQLQTALRARGIESEVVNVPTNEWLAKLTLEGNRGNLCIYTNSKGKAKAQTHEIKDQILRAIIDEALVAIGDLNQLGKANPEPPLPTAPQSPNGKNVTVYTDGSGEGGQCGWAAIFVAPQTTGGQEFGRFSGNLGPQSSGQIAGEVEAAIVAIKFALEKKLEKIEIRHDYTGIRDWPQRNWKAKDPDAKNLVAWADYAFHKGLKIQYTWTKGHAGDPGNEAADQLASEASRRPATARTGPPPALPKKQPELSLEP